MKPPQPMEFAQQSLTRSLLRIGLIALGLFMLAAAPSRAQSVPGIYRPSLPSSSGDDVSNPNADIDHEKMLRILNAERQKAMVSDTNKLLRLVKQFNDQVARTNPDQLTPDQLRQLAAIEKLAHSVKEKMSTSVRGTPPFQSPMQPLQ